jgi:hypothetical protein
MSAAEKKLAGDLLLIAAGSMHEADDVSLIALVPDLEERRALMRECLAQEGRPPAAALSEYRYAPLKLLMHWLAMRLWEEAKT